MRLWVDTRGAARAEALFGVAPIERLRRSVGKLDAASVVLSGPAAGAVEWPGATSDADAGPVGARLQRALAGAASARVPAPGPGQGPVADAGTADAVVAGGGSEGGVVVADDPEGGLVVVDGANAIDPRLIAFLLRTTRCCVAARGEGAHRAVALRMDASLADAIPPEARDLREVADALLARGRIAPLDEQEFPAYVDKLRRSLPYWLHAVNDAATRRHLERRMFWDNYKGSTDLLTRWVYPPLVWPLVRLCTRLRIHPNAVTLLSIALTVAAVPLFARGDFLLGFLCAYGMSVLDSVDGKVARVTLTDSKIGNILDHGIDQVHPPFWYFAWAWGLGARAFDDPLYQVAVWLIVFYVADRLVLSVAKHRLGFALHAATRLDGQVRSFIARRNITMTIMAIALLLGQGAAGFYIVTAWQGLTFAWHGARTLWLGFLSRSRVRPQA